MSNLNKRRCPSCDERNIYFSFDDEKFGYEGAQLTYQILKGRCTSCAFTWADEDIELVRTMAINDHLKVENARLKRELIGLEDQVKREKQTALEVVATKSEELKVAIAPFKRAIIRAIMLANGQAVIEAPEIARWENLLKN